MSENTLTTEEINTIDLASVPTIEGAPTAPSTLPLTIVIGVGERGDNGAFAQTARKTMGTVDAAVKSSFGDDGAVKRSDLVAWTLGDSRLTKSGTPISGGTGIAVPHAVAARIVAVVIGETELLVRSFDSLESRVRGLKAMTHHVVGTLALAVESGTGNVEAQATVVVPAKGKAKLYVGAQWRKDSASAAFHVPESADDLMADGWTVD